MKLRTNCAGKRSFSEHATFVNRERCAQVKQSKMKSLTTIILVFIHIVCYCQREIGILSVDFDEQIQIDFYETSALEKKLETIRFFQDKSINSLNIENLESHKDWLQPETLWLDYYRLNFRVKSVKEGCYEIYVSDKRTMWIKDKEFTDFLFWEEYFKQMFAITRKDPTEQKVYERPDLQAKKIKYSAGEDCFNVKSLTGDWIEIFTPKHCTDETSNELKSGWIRWKDGNKLLINYFPTS